MLRVGFEPTPPKRTELESAALDPSAIEAYCMCFTFFRLRLKIYFQHKKSANSSVVRIPRCQRGGPGSIPG